MDGCDGEVVKECGVDWMDAMRMRIDDDGADGVDASLFEPLSVDQGSTHAHANVKADGRKHHRAVRHQVEDDEPKMDPLDSFRPGRD